MSVGWSAAPDDTGGGTKAGLASPDDAGAGGFALQAARQAVSSAAAATSAAVPVGNKREIRWNCCTAHLRWRQWLAVILHILPCHPKMAQAHMDRNRHRQGRSVRYIVVLTLNGATFDQPLPIHSHHALNDGPHTIDREVGSPQNH